MIKKSKSLVAVPPGYTIKEQLDDRGLTQKEFALRMELSEKHVSKLINGEVLLTSDVAIRLENVLGIPAQFWLNLESIFREKLKKIELENNMEEDKCIAAKMPYNQMVKYGWIIDTSDKSQRVFNLRKYFEINRLGLLLEKANLNVLFRRVAITDNSNFALMTWAQQAKIKSRECKVDAINIKDLKKSIELFRSMTNKNLEDVFEELVDTLSSNGVALILLPHLEGTFLHGATFYYDNKIVLGLTIRGKDLDKFWFSFFHELGHITLGHINKDYYDEMEEEANDFAKNTLIPEDKYKSFISKGNFGQQDIIRFANEIGVYYDIVLGRLQKDNFLPFSKYSWMKRKYNFK